MKGETSWISMRWPASGEPFQMPDGRWVKEIGEKVFQWPVHPAIAGLIANLTEESRAESWTKERRDHWLRLLEQTLDLAYPPKAGGA
jgi:hypothetical protein